MRLGGRKKNSGEGLTKKGKKGNLGPEPTLRRRGGAKKVVRRGAQAGVINYLSRTFGGAEQKYWGAMAPWPTLYRPPWLDSDIEVTHF